MKKMYVGALVLALAGCATTEGYKAVLQSWEGSTEQALVDSWGPPDSVYESDGGKYLTYARSASGYMPGSAPTYTTHLIGNTAYTNSYGGSAGYAYTLHCKTTFKIEKKKISSWRFEGNNCVAKNPQK